MPSRPVERVARALSVGEYQAPDKMAAHWKCRLCSEMQGKSLNDSSHVPFLQPHLLLLGAVILNFNTILYFQEVTQQNCHVKSYSLCLSGCISATR